MRNKETPQKRKKRFKSMSSQERISLIREKLKAQGLQEGSGVPGKDLSSYDRDEIWDVIEVTSCLPWIKTQKSVSNSNFKSKKSLIISLLIVLAFASGTVLYHQQYNFIEMRRELSIDGMFFD